MNASPAQIALLSIQAKAPTPTARAGYPLGSNFAPIPDVDELRQMLRVGSNYSDIRRIGAKGQGLCCDLDIDVARLPAP
jgi:hypothetical protein